MIEEGGGWEKQTLTPCVSPVLGSLLAEPLSLITVRTSSLCPSLDLEVEFPYALLLELVPRCVPPWTWRLSSLVLCFSNLFP